MPFMLSNLPLSSTITVSLLWNSLKVLIMPSWDLSVSTIIAQSECSLTIVALCRKNSAETTSTTVTVVCRMERRRHRAWPALLSTTSPATSCSPVLRQWPRSLAFSSSMSLSLKMVRSIAVSLSFVYLGFFWSMISWSFGALYAVFSCFKIVPRPSFCMTIYEVNGKERLSIQ